MPEAEQKLAEKLSAIIQTVDVADAMTTPLMDSIKHLLKQTAALMNCDEASIIVRDGNEGDLRFLAAIGEVADKLMNVKIPAGKGIAGFVFSSGSPMAIADVGQESAFYEEIDKQTGYTTQTILATPLRFEGEIIGVLEYVNRLGEPPFEPFSPDEMDRAALYADAFSPLINAHEFACLIESLFLQLLKNANSDDIKPDEIKSWLTSVRSAEEHREMLNLALLVREVACRGAAERQLAGEILQSIVHFSEKNSSGDVSFLSF
jgi:GAF domain